MDELYLTPRFDSNYVAVAMSSSNEYVPYLSVCLQSLLDNSDSKHNYDIIIFERSITDVNKKKLSAQIERTNISLRFTNPAHIINNFTLKFPEHYNLECYFRLAAPVLLKNYDKIIFTDVDLIFNSDVYWLYQYDLGAFPIAACLDLMWGAFLRTSDADWYEYSQDVLHLKNPYKYFNTGVMLLNNKLFNANNYTRKLLEFVSKNYFRILEQDGLNAFFQDNIKYIDSAWNYPIANKFYINIINNMPSHFYKQYISDRKNPYIIHFAGNAKPWYLPEEEFASVWWAYARKSPFYEQIIQKLQSNILSEMVKSENYLQNLKKHYYSICLAYLKSKLFSKIFQGKIRNHHIQKQKRLKQQILLVRNSK